MHRRRSIHGSEDTGLEVMDGNVSPLQLQCSVLQEFPTQVSPIPFPPKRWVGSNLEPGFLGRRLSGLQLFLGSLLEVKEVLGHPGLVAFLCLDTPSCSDDVTMESSRVGANTSNLEIDTIPSTTLFVPLAFILNSNI